MKAYIYSLQEDKAHIKKTVANVIPTEPTLSLSEQKEVKVKGFRIMNFKRMYRKKIWYQTDTIFILPEEDDEEAYFYFRSVLEKRSKKAIDEFVICERIVDVFWENHKKGKIIIEK